MEPHSSIKALVIEDDREMANLLKRIISNKFSINVEVAFDCATARRKMNEADYDVITLDYRLPDGAGLDLLDEITEGGLDHPPVIMVTGHRDEETAARSFRSRASGYVVKDAKLPEMLVDAVQKALAEISLKRIEKELLEEKVFIEDALNGLPDLFAVVDTDGKFFRWNEKVGEVTGYTNAEISQMNIVELFIEEDRPVMLEGMSRLRNDGYAVDEVVLETKAGEHRIYELCGRLLRNFDGIPVGYSGIGRDITERVMASRELSRYRDELEQIVTERTYELEEANKLLEIGIGEQKQAELELRLLNAELEGYAQTVSHDLRAPLTAIKLAADNLALLVQKEAEGKIDDLPAEITRMGEVIGESTTKAEDLISDLLKLARAGQKPEELSDVDVGETVKRVIEEHANDIEKKGVTLLVGKDLGMIRANPIHVYQVFSNLIDNSIKHNDASKPKVEVKYEGRRGEAHFYSVEDNGSGIPPEDLEKIFLPFYRGDTGSTGIGLAIVEKLVKLYGGHIVVRSNNGTSFEFSLKDQ